MDGDDGPTLNPLATIGAAVLGSGAAAVEEAVGGGPAPTEDSNAVASAVPHEQLRIGRLLSDSEGRPSLLHRCLQGLVLFNAGQVMYLKPAVDASWAVRTRRPSLRFASFDIHLCSAVPG